MLCFICHISYFIFYILYFIFYILYFIFHILYFYILYFIFHIFIHRQVPHLMSFKQSWLTTGLTLTPLLRRWTLADFPAVFLHISNFDICHDKYKYKISWVGQSTRWTPALMGIAPGWPQSFTNLVVLHIFFSLLLIYQICRNYPSWISLLSSPDCSKWRSLAFGPHPSLQSACSSYS